MSFTLDQKFKSTDIQTSTTIEDKCIILQFKDGVYYELDEVGSTVWDQLNKDTVSLLELKNLIMTQYEVDQETCLTDLKELLHELLEQDLIEKIED